MGMAITLLAGVLTFLAWPKLLGARKKPLRNWLKSGETEWKFGRKWRKLSDTSLT